MNGKNPKQSLWNQESQSKFIEEKNKTTLKLQRHQKQLEWLHTTKKRWTGKFPKQSLWDQGKKSKLRVGKKIR